MPPIPPPPYPPPPPLLRHDWDWLARLAPVVRASASRFRLCTVLEIDARGGGAAPLAAVVQLPAAAVGPPVDLAVLADVHVVVPARHGGAARRWTCGRPRRLPRSPLARAALTQSSPRTTDVAPPVAVDVAALRGARGGPRPGIVGLRPGAAPGTRRRPRRRARRCRSSGCRRPPARPRRRGHSRRRSGRRCPCARCTRCPRRTCSRTASRRRRRRRTRSTTPSRTPSRPRHSTSP